MQKKMFKAEALASEAIQLLYCSSNPTESFLDNEYRKHFSMSVHISLEAYIKYICLLHEDALNLRLLALLISVVMLHSVLKPSSDI